MRWGIAQAEPWCSDIGLVDSKRVKVVIHNEVEQEAPNGSLPGIGTKTPSVDINAASQRIRNNKGRELI